MYRLQYVFILFVCNTSLLFSQSLPGTIQHKKVRIQDTIVIDSVSINPFRFTVRTINKNKVDASEYQVNFEEAQLYPDNTLLKSEDSLLIEYVRYPDFLTKKYQLLDPKIIVNSKNGKKQRYQLSQPSLSKNFTPFDGLNTSGSLSRGLTVGNGQNTVLNSELDLQITGKISENVSIRASIQDANVPVQQGGYSQNLDEFDQVFIEIFNDKWNLRAGDVILQNSDSYFNRFTKNVQGVSIAGTIDHENSKTGVFAAGALVRGVFTRSQFIAQEGNQGPYKLTGPNGELFVLIVSGSERVYVNGILLERGENKQYIIDYNAGEVRFNPTYPITSEMRISIEYQTTDRNYSRIIAYGGGSHTTEKLNLEAFVYSENDAKNQPLQQNLSDEQIGILAEAGDDMSQMIAPSSVADTFSENKILYRKEIRDNTEIFVFAETPQEDLFNVRFTLVGENQGNYILENLTAIRRIYRYVSPINGVPQGSYAPVVRLVAPERLQTAVVKGSYQPTENTSIAFETAGSRNDRNLFSDTDDGDNNGFAGKLQLQHRLIQKDSSWTLDTNTNLDYIDNRFQSIERIYAVEFNRDWNLPELTTGDQQFITSGFNLFHPKIGATQYAFQYLDFKDSYSGNRHLVTSDLQWKNFTFELNTSVLNSNSSVLNSTFFRWYSGLTYNFKNKWIGTRIAAEDNQEIEKQTDIFTPLSQKFVSQEYFMGIGDSLKVYAKVGYRHRVNDSLRNNSLQRVNTSSNYYLQSRPIASKNTQLSLYANYRELNSKDENTSDEKTLTSRVLYNQQLFQNKVNLNTLFETSSGTLPQQEFTYVEVEPGQGTFTWIDYNNNNLQELNEFEIAQFTDQATYLRVLLPNQIFIKTNQNKFSQIVTLSPISWSGSKNKFRKFLSHFYNQTTYLIDRRNLRNTNSFKINLFSNDDELSLLSSFRNTLFFNRGKQHFTTNYTYLASENKNELITGSQENSTKSHELVFQHKIQESWVLENRVQQIETISAAENFDNRNYTLSGIVLAPKISYLLSDQNRFSLFYQLDDQDNTDGQEQLKQQTLGASFTFAKKQKSSITGEFNYIDNNFEGNAFSPVGYQLLDGLQPGVNFTWSLLIQQKLTKYLDLNISYLGRNSENSRTIHTGTVQLRAFF
ncbi:hypothetical protein NBT05_06670 [Aquimarina sp. ERC-38]|uniref:hypothetical protein n=1 Tax=Aquimarina sp. ERC-38 TaxID=2949996 RepID=UPI002248171F|nr:hypothetical protein [Aquimarina sp. ERC-38]UZO82150.1 hypothetical protein NBT05_06670 [Aquimarina sp. ERC-38]